MQSLMCAFISMHLHKTFDVLDKPSKEENAIEAKIAHTNGNKIVLKGRGVER